MLLASFAVTGLALSCDRRVANSIRIAGSKRRGTTRREDCALVHRCCSFPSVFGCCWRCLKVQSQRIMSSGTAILFGIAVVTALWLMHQLAMVALGDVSRRRLSVATLMMALVVVLMTATLQCSR